ncbi:hypothetical protein [Streptomyces sp. JHA26]|uniref:hypothetical protein n=1 Tax=Streptomyces sp. JHA26 TaxID=1917143 RepID=UPI000989C6DA|nr:hypothetical protein [Streptomyces sp. JHA26]
MSDRTRTAERYARGLVAAAVAVAALVLAGNAGPAPSAEDPPEGGSVRVEEVGGHLASDVRLDGSTPTPRPDSG